MRVRVLPRDVASRIITGTIARMGWMVGASLTVLAFPILIETMVLRGRADELPIPLAMLVVILLGIVAVIRWRRTPVVVAFLAIAAAASLVFELELLRGDPGILDDAIYLLNRPNLAIVAVGAIATTPWGGILWRLLGLGIATAVTLVAALAVDVPFRPGFGPTMVFLIATVGYLTLAGVQRRQRRQVPNFDALEEETQRLARGEDLARRTTAAIHDTVLNDLAIVLTTGDRLDARAIDRLKADIEQLRSAEWISQTSAIRLGRHRRRQPPQRHYEDGERFPVAGSQHSRHRLGVGCLQTRSRGRPGIAGRYPGRDSRTSSGTRASRSPNSNSSMTTSSRS